MLIAIFIAQNTHQVGIDFPWLSFDSAMWFVLLITTIVGSLIGLLTAPPRPSYFLNRPHLSAAPS